MKNSHPMAQLSLALMVLGFLGMPFSGVRAQSNGLLAGVAQVDITPTSLGPMWGYGARGKTRATGVADPLMARAVVLRDTQGGIALISLDLGRPPVGEQVAILRKKARSLGIQGLFVVASHTHHGPVLERDQQGAWPETEAYQAQLLAKLTQILEEADKTKQPCTLSIATEQTDLNRNRHDRNPNPPRDGRFTLLSVEKQSGGPLVRMVHFAAHPVWFPTSDLRYSPDWPGVMCRTLEKETGAPCLFLQGAEGDLSPRLPEGAPWPEKPNYERFGRVMAQKAKSLASQTQKLSKCTISAKSEKIRLPVRIDPSNPFTKMTLGRAFYPELIRHYETEYRGGALTTTLEVATLGPDLSLVGIAGEPFCEHALKLQERWGVSPVLTMGCCNDYHQYFPTLQALPKGGYGTEPWIAPTIPGSGEYLFNRALVHLYKLSGKIPANLAPDSGGFHPLPD